MHKNMKFVIQTCQEGKLPYLDTQVVIKDNKIITSTFRKPTSTGVLLNFKSCVPQLWKRILVKNLYYRNKNFVSEDLQNNEWQNVKEFKKKSSFPTKFIDDQKQKKNNFESKLIENTDDNKYYITIPSVRKISDKFSKNIKAMFEEIGVKTCIVYKTQKVGKYFSLKGSTNCVYQSCFVYKFTCPVDLNNQFISETEKQLFVRIKEHVNPSYSAVFKHIENCAYFINCNNFYNCFETIKTCSSYIGPLSTEA